MNMTSVPHVVTFAQTDLFKKNPIFSSLGSYWFTKFPNESQWEWIGWLAFQSWFVYNPRFSASNLLFLMPASCWFPASLTLQPWRCGWHVPPGCNLHWITWC
jgi:hypothetical protein